MISPFETQNEIQANLAVYERSPVFKRWNSYIIVKIVGISYAFEFEIIHIR